MDKSTDQIWISNLPKLIIAGLTIVCITFLLAMHTVTPEAGLPIISATGIYILTNGVRAARVAKAPGDPVEVEV